MSSRPRKAFLEAQLKSGQALPITAPVQRLRLSLEPWTAAWPQDRVALVQALAVAAAFPELVGAARIMIAGDVEAALATLLEDLAALGLSPDDLPTVELMAGDGAGAAHVGALPATLAASCEYERRSWTEVFPHDDVQHAAVWALAADAVASGRTVTVLAESLDGLGEVPSPDRISMVCGQPAVRRRARRSGVGAVVPRPPAARYLPTADVIVCDGRRPDDLALLGGSRSDRSEMVAVNVRSLTAPALAALGAGRVRAITR